VLPDILRLWDAILSEKDKFYFVYYIALSILKIRKDDMMSLDFAGIIMNLQTVSQINVETIFAVVKKIKKEFDKKIKNMINSNIIEKKK
jgi:hypothetical protein